MKKALIKKINNILSKKGLQLIKNYEITHLNFKYIEALDEIYSFYRAEVFTDLEDREGRRKYLSNLYGTQIGEAIYLIHYLSCVEDVDGDICEFGCANGATSALIANEIKHTSKKLWLFDSFKGLSQPSEKDVLIDDMFSLGNIENYEGTMSYSTQEVKSRLNDVGIHNNRVKIIKGFIDQSLKRKNLPSKISLAFIDFDLYEPIKLALEFTNSRLTHKGYIIVDDYKFFSSGVEKAVEEFLKKYKKQYELILPREYAGHFCILYKK